VAARQILRVFKAQMLLPRQEDMSVREHGIQDLTVLARLLVGPDQAGHMIGLVEVVCIQEANDVGVFIQGAHGSYRPRSAPEITVRGRQIDRHQVADTRRDFRPGETIGDKVVRDFRVRLSGNAVDAPAENRLGFLVVRGDDGDFHFSISPAEGRGSAVNPGRTRDGITTLNAALSFTT
jgi:hypothetical protein